LIYGLLFFFTDRNLAMDNKAKKAIIKLGSLELDVYQLPNGSYRMSQTQAFISIADDDYSTKQAAKRFIEKITSKQAKALVPQGFGCIEKVKIEGTGLEINSISLTDVPNFWLLFAADGNIKASLLLAACAIETLERRADSAFNIQRTEEERNDRLQTRVESKIARRTLTDSFKYYLENNLELSSNYKKYIYPNSTDYLNGVVLGVKSKQAKDHYQLKESGAIRDHIPTEALRELKFAEELASRFIVEDGLEPFEAVKKACEIGKIKQIGLE
jgi:hypothetical protein